jgi:hypothetical protein
MQQGFDSLDAGSARLFIDNPVKLGLSVLSVVFDLLFMYQVD